jgi:hypothetical protein
MRIYLTLMGAIILASTNVCAQQLPKVKKPKVKASQESLESLDAASPAGTSRFLIKLYGGYGAAVGNTYNYFAETGTSADNFVDFFNDANVNPPSPRALVKENTRGLGTGPRLGIGIAYIVNDYINLGVDIDYFRSSISRSRTDVRTFRPTGPGVTPQTLATASNFTYDANVVTVSPNIVFKAITRNNFYVYNRLGFTITPFYDFKRVDKTNIKITGNSAAAKDSSIFKRYTVDLKLPIGFFASFGANFKLSGRIRLFVEAQYSSIIFTPKKRTVVEYTENGVNLLNELAQKKQYKEEVFKKQFNVPTPILINNNAFPIDYTIPREIPAVRIPITNFSFLAGLTYRF